MGNINLLPEETGNTAQIRGEPNRVVANPLNLPLPEVDANVTVAPVLPSLNEAGVKNIKTDLPPKIEPAQLANVTGRPVAISQPVAVMTPLSVFKEVSLPPLPETAPRLKARLEVMSNSGLGQPADPLTAAKSSTALSDQTVLDNIPASKSFLGGLFGGKKKKGKILKTELDKAARGGLSDEAFNVNLIPEGSDLIPNKILYRRLFFAVAAGAGLVVFALISLLLAGAILNQKDQSLMAELQQADLKFNQLKESNTASANWQIQMAQLTELFTSHVYWTKFFSLLEKITLPQVYYSDITAAVDGTIELSAQADSYLSVARQYLALQQQPEIKSVVVSDLSSSQGEAGVSFSISLELAPEIYFNKLTD